MSKYAVCLCMGLCLFANVVFTMEKQSRIDLDQLHDQRYREIRLRRAIAQSNYDEINTIKKEIEEEKNFIQRRYGIQLTSAKL